MSVLFHRNKREICRSFVSLLNILFTLAPMSEDQHAVVEKAAPKHLGENRDHCLSMRIKPFVPTMYHDEKKVDVLLHLEVLTLL